MAVKINGQTYYRTAEVCRRVGISRTTLHRWLKQGIANEAEHRDWRGWRLFSEGEVNRLMQQANRLLDPEEAKPLFHPNLLLSQRQCDILKLCAAGLVTRDIADKLYISEATAKKELAYIFDRLGVSDRAQAVFEAMKRKLI